MPAPMPDAENVVAVLLVTTFARFAAPDVDPASITYVVTGSPEAGAVQVRVTVLPLAPEVRFSGAPGAVAAAPTTARGEMRVPEKHAESADPWRHEARSAALPPNSDAVAACPTVALVPDDNGCDDREGAAGEGDPPQAEVSMVATTNRIDSVRFISGHSRRQTGRGLDRGQDRRAASL